MGGRQKADSGSIGEDGRVRLRAYLPLAKTHWLSAGCCGLRGCQRIVPIGVAEAIRLMGTGEATVGQLERRLRCSACGGREIKIHTAVDPRPPEVREREGRMRETRATLGRRED